MSLRAATIGIATAIVSTALTIGVRAQESLSSPTPETRHAFVLLEDQPATDLTAADFRLIETGTRTEISIEQGPGDGRMAVAIVVDTRISAGSWPLLESAGLILDALPESACVAVIVYDEERRQQVRGTAAADELRAALRETESSRPMMLGLRWGARVRWSSGDDIGFELPDALTAAYQALAEPEPPQCTPSTRGPVTRRLAIALTGSTSAHDIERIDALELPGAGSVPMLILAPNPRPSPGSFEVRGNPSPFPPLHALERLIGRTGGHLFRATRGSYPYDSIWRQLQRLIAALDGWYVLEVGAPAEVVRPLHLGVADERYELLGVSGDS